MDLNKLRVKYIDGYETRVDVDGKTQKDKILPYMTIVYPYRGHYEICLGDDPLATLPHGAGCYITVPGARHTIVHRLNPGEDYMMPRWMRLSVTYDDVLDVTGWFVPPLFITGQQAQPFIQAVDELVVIGKAGNVEQAMFAKMRIAAQVLEALVQVSKFCPTRLETEQIYPAILLVKDRYAQQITVQQMASVCSMAPSTFHRVFRTVTKMTPMQYLEDYRLKQAVPLLFEKQTFAQIAESCGYCDEFHFSRNFKARYGISPREYKKSMIL